MHHDTKSAIETFNFAILMRTVTTSRFHDITCISSDILKGDRAPKLNSLIKAESMVTSWKTILEQEGFNKVNGWGLAGSEKNPSESSFGIRNEDIGIVSIIGVNNT